MVGQGGGLGRPAHAAYGRDGLGLVEDAIDERLIRGRVATLCPIQFVAQPLEPGDPLTDRMDGGRSALFQSL